MPALASDWRPPHCPLTAPSPLASQDDSPEASWKDIPDEDKAEAMKYGDMMGGVALDILTKAKA